MDVILFISTFILFHQQQFQCRRQKWYFYYERKGIKIESKWNIHDWIQLRWRYLRNPGKLFKGMNNVIKRYFFSYITYAFKSSSLFPSLLLPPNSKHSVRLRPWTKQNKHKTWKLETYWINTCIQLIFHYLHWISKSRGMVYLINSWIKNSYFPGYLKNRKKGILWTKLLLQYFRIPIKTDKSHHQYGYFSWL